MSHPDAVIPRRQPLSRDRVLAAAVLVADREGLSSITMRSVADRLGVEAMALYRHVASKDDLLDSLADVVIGEINAACDALPDAGDSADWRGALRRRILTARSTLLRHPWAPTLIGTRGTMSLELMRYFDGFSGVMVEAGFSIDFVHHALHAFGTRALGWAPEVFQPGAPPLEDPDAALEAVAALSDRLPYVARVVEQLLHDADTTVGWCDDQTEFEFGLDVMLDGLEARRLRESGGGSEHVGTD